jgi:hypothetical protein
MTERGESRLPVDSFGIPRLKAEGRSIFTSFNWHVNRAISGFLLDFEEKAIDPFNWHGFLFSH